MSDHIPPELFPNILSRLSVEPLLRFRCVCKSWQRLIDDPDFVKLHLLRQSEAGGNLFLSSNRTNGKLYTLSTNSLYNYSESPTNTLEASPLSTLTSNDFQVPNILSSSDHMFSSCNGLILIDCYRKDELMIWNPFRREFFRRESFLLPRDIREEFCRTVYFGLGYDFVSDDYKIVKIKRHPICWKTWVYSLKLSSWKIITDSPFPPYSDYRGVICPPNWSYPGVFFNGRLHWITISTGDIKGASAAILAFDLATEDYHFLPLPVILTSESRLDRLDDFGECLFLTCPSDSIYRLDDYGGTNKWTKLFSFSDIVASYIGPIAYLKTKGELLFIVSYRKAHYFWVNIDKGCAKKMNIEDDEFSITYNLPLSCNASLVRLSKYTGTDITTMKSSASSDRLQLMLTTTNVENNTNDIWPAIHNLLKMVR